ncbi:tol-pal system-associated acyl-CoA thioesterase [Pseudoroseicyclus tamaricis]|uniref:Tol-pal system-associated acyl-CoA thioesterase n=1 Tax=Pseudoroseicyclus tamaricis TaxID=2705421 RepID=A0A6B2JVB9_9RHOB|nr:tol-pal system-associated acyl-CoA thioesterase [Pseudoroseicyclus tamaricis]NDV01835.1 tol-pal system-associated acyl-CoA thioesterase [Pseudoroseicyclus tamaricis]
MAHRFTTRVYYEDVDLAGIVYYANYLRFIERARSEWVRELGLDQRALKAEGLVFAVRRIEADYLAPARFDDVIEVTTAPERVQPARALLLQEVRRGAELLFAAKVTIVAIGPRERAVRLPPALRAAAPEQAPAEAPGEGAGGKTRA